MFDWIFSCHFAIDKIFIKKYNYQGEQLFTNNIL